MNSVRWASGSPSFGEGTGLGNAAWGPGAQIEYGVSRRGARGREGRGDEEEGGGKEGEPQPSPDLEAQRFHPQGLSQSVPRPGKGRNMGRGWEGVFWLSV